MGYVLTHEWLFSYLSEQKELVSYTYQVQSKYPHDSQAFTQGLLLDNGFLYESTGLYGESSLRKVDLATGRVVQKILVDEKYFAEGLTLTNNAFIQLTWKSHVGFLFDKVTLKLIGFFQFPYEGWGITFDGKNIITSDGSEILRFFNPDDFSLTKEIQVHFGSRKFPQLNELEFINGKIYANVWHTDLILIIDPAHGKVTGWIDLTNLEEQSDLSKRVLNGIAYDQKNDRLFVTGKLWPYLYEIELFEKTP